MNFINLEGKTFGRWTVTSFWGIENSTYYWNCTCSCGTSKVIGGARLRNGVSTSCGCLTKELKEKNKVIKPPENLSGKKFNKLTVLNLEETRDGKHYWNCVCDCGEKTSVEQHRLIKGMKKSCGCLHNTNSIDITNQRFGKLTVLRLNKRNGSTTYWDCLCDCGKYGVFIGNNLKNGNTKSCGCISKTKLIDLTGKNFGMLRVIKYDRKKRTHTYWICECSCGNIVSVKGASLREGSSKSCGCLNESHVAFECKRYFVEHYMAIIEHKECINPETGRFLPYDIYIPNNRVYIEINGKQHYIKTKKGWYSSDEAFEYRKKLDKIKKKHARKNGIYIEIDLRKIKTVEKAVEYIENILKNYTKE